jgi:hypothetical protein
MEEAEYFMLKYCENNIDSHFSVLLNNNWVTRPGISPGWIIRNIDDLYIITDFNKTDLMIGFFTMVQHKKKQYIHYFEILPQYQHKGYARNLLKHMRCDGILESSNDSFWTKMGFDLFEFDGPNIKQRGA